MVVSLFSALMFTGSDARSFLQGQFTNDVRHLARERALMGSINSAQGRAQSMLTLIERSEGIYAILPVDDLEPIQKRLRGFVLSAKVDVQVAQGWRVSPCSEHSIANLPEHRGSKLEPGACLSGVDFTLLRWWSGDERYLLLARDTWSGPPIDAGCAETWRLRDIQAGLPVIRPETRNSFVPQTINLDLLQGMSYDKGCYVGQEVVARQRRAGVRRRMGRFASTCAPPTPGTRVFADSDGVSERIEVGEVVDAAATPQGCELLAVVDVQPPASPEDGASHGARGPLFLPNMIPLSPLTLPYLPSH
ncbi:MAG TPA: hypothetical protein VFQ61_38730 [Polyangiaceae bacterium]|nr:hypothetical protein [Polyangiaceae bacterium]